MIIFNQNKKTTKNKNGFSLMEVMVSMFIVLLILLVVYAIFSFSQQIKPKIENRAEIVQNQRAIIDRISRELRQANNIVTTLPANEIVFEDGHGNLEDSPLQYLRYHLIGTNLYREIRYYYFNMDPSTHVHYDETDDLGNLPSINIVEDRLIGEYISSLSFNIASNNINIEATLILNNETLIISTYVSPRNL
jgi:prepilin-type N-terminal cleavage/methylation domain-containing protein